MSPSLYLHIPFCIKRCIYCDFVSNIYEPGSADNYIAAIKKELSNIPDTSPFSTLFIGGGTPTALSAESLSDLITNIFNHFQFLDNYEATIEANPGTLDADKLHVLLDAGINRISLGVQSFNNEELSFLGRIHSNDEAEYAVYLANEAGFKNIGIDLIYGIPGQSLESWRKTLETAVSLKPQHISTYELTVEKGTELDIILNTKSPLSHTLFKKRPSLLSEDLIIEMYDHTIDYLTSKGLIHYEISNFARPDYECRHNLNYWNRGEYFGAGLGAHSFVNGKRFHNTINIDRYLNAIRNNAPTGESSEDIAGDMALSEALFLGLRKSGGINIESLSRKYNINILDTYSNEIKGLQEAGLVELTASDHLYKTALRLTRKGLLLSNEVFEKFI